MAVHMDIRLVLLVVMLFGSLTAKPVEDPAPSRYYYGGESNDYFDVGKLFPILSWKQDKEKEGFEIYRLYVAYVRLQWELELNWLTQFKIDGEL